MVDRPNRRDASAAAPSQNASQAGIQPVKLCLYRRGVLPRVAEPVHDVCLIARDGIRRSFPFFYFCPKLVYSHAAPPIKIHRVGDHALAG